MIKKVIIIFICLLLLTVAVPQSTHAVNWIKLASAVKKITDYINTVRKSVGLVGYIPHNFPFGGHITSSERACSLRFRIWVWVPTPLGFPVPIPCPSCGFIPFPGRAITVGPPLASPGKMITFPWVSDIYRHHNENRVGPWALGLGFSPFPLGEINRALGLIAIGIPPSPLDCPGSPNIGKVCFDDFHMDCQASGEKDRAGNDIYQVIRKLGTGP